MSQLAPVFPTQDIQQMKSIYNCAVFTRKTISLRQLIAFSRDQMICVTQRMEIRVGSKVTPSNTWVKDAAFVQWNMHNCRLFKFCLHFLCEASLHFFLLLLAIPLFLLYYYVFLDVYRFEYGVRTPCTGCIYIYSDLFMLHVSWQI